MKSFPKAILLTMFYIFHKKMFFVYHKYISYDFELI